MRGREAEHVGQPKDNLFATRLLRSKVENLEMSSNSCADAVVALQGLVLVFRQTSKKFRLPQLDHHRLPPPPQHRDDV